MLRFIDLKGQIYLDNEPCFGWFTTITDSFHGFNGNEHWHTKESFIEDFNEALKQHPIADPLERYLRLIPDDYFKKDVPDLSEFDFKIADNEGFWGKDYPPPYGGYFNCSGKFIPNADNSNPYKKLISDTDNEVKNKFKI